MLSQGKPRDATVNFDTYWILQRHQLCIFCATAQLSCIHQWPFKCWNYTQYTDFHDCDTKSRW